MIGRHQVVGHPRCRQGILPIEASTCIRNTAASRSFRSVGVVMVHVPTACWVERKVNHHRASIDHVIEVTASNQRPDGRTAPPPRARPASTPPQRRDRRDRIGRMRSYVGMPCGGKRQGIKVPGGRKGHQRCLEADGHETSCGVVLVNLGAVLLLRYPQAGLPEEPRRNRDGGDHPSNGPARWKKRRASSTSISSTPSEGTRSTYSFRHKGRLVHKEVHWLLAETETLQVRLSTNTGHLWFGLGQAEEVLSHEESRAVLRSARDMMRALGRD